jgi:CRP-like cAMP-binding protein
VDYHFLSQTVLFRGISPQDVQSMMTCLQAFTRSYPRGAVIHHAGDTIHCIGMVLSGSVSIENDDVWGNKSILDRVAPGQIFAETYACVPGERLMINVVAAEPVEVLFLNTDKMFTVCSSSCTFHNKLVRNMLSIAAQKSLNLSRRIMHTSSKSIRGRLLSYLSFQAAIHNGREFDIPFNRQQLADYLSVDRSAMSNELSKMQSQGLIEYNKNTFKLL